LCERIVSEWVWECVRGDGTAFVSHFVSHLVQIDEVRDKVRDKAPIVR